MKKRVPEDVELKNGRIFVHQDFHTIESVLGNLSDKLNLDEKKKDFSIMLFWKEFITENAGELIAQNTAAQRFTKDRKLVIAIKSAVIANELQFSKAVIEEEFIKAVKPHERDITGLVFELR